MAVIDRKSPCVRVACVHARQRSNLRFYHMVTIDVTEAIAQFCLFAKLGGGVPAEPSLNVHIVQSI